MTKTAADLYHMAGTDSLDEVIANWEAERQAMRELHDTNTALVIYNRRIRLIVTLAIKAFDMLEEQGSMFLPSKVMDIITQVRDQISKADRALTAQQGNLRADHPNSRHSGREERAAKLIVGC